SSPASGRGPATSIISTGAPTPTIPATCISASTSARARQPARQQQANLAHSRKRVSHPASWTRAGRGQACRSGLWRSQISLVFVLVAEGAEPSDDFWGAHLGCPFFLRAVDGGP